MAARAAAERDPPSNNDKAQSMLRAGSSTCEMRLRTCSDKIIIATRKLKTYAAFWSATFSWSPKVDGFQMFEIQIRNLGRGACPRARVFGAASRRQIGNNRS